MIHLRTTSPARGDTRPVHLVSLRDLLSGPSIVVSAPRSASSDLGLASKPSRARRRCGGLTSRLQGALRTTLPPCFQARQTVERALRYPTPLRRAWQGLVLRTVELGSSFSGPRPRVRASSPFVPRGTDIVEHDVVASRRRERSGEGQIASAHRGARRWSSLRPPVLSPVQGSQLRPTSALRRARRSYEALSRGPNRAPQRAVGRRRRSEERLSQPRARVEARRDSSSIRGPASAFQRRHPSGSGTTRNPRVPGADIMLANEEKLVGKRPFHGVSPPSTSSTQAATDIGLTSPDFAAPSGFLSLLTRCSTHAVTALFHAASVHGVSASRGFPLPLAATTFAARCPSCLWSRRGASDFRGCADGRSVHVGSVLPGSLRPILSWLFHPLKGFPLESRLHITAKPPLMGFSQRWITPSL